jgi:hypothetical protein
VLLAAPVSAPAVVPPATFRVTIGVGPAAPSPIVPPSITGDLIVGHTLTCDAGTWSDDPTFTYQWRNDFLAIAGATNPTYTLIPADGGHTITCVVTATNAVGSTVQWAWAHGLPVGVATNHAPPTLSGPPMPGGKLACSSGFWTTGTLVPPTFSYTWLRDGRAIPGAAAATRTARSSDAGHMLSCRVTATDAAGSAYAMSTPVRVSPSSCLSTRRILLHLLPAARKIRSASVLVDGSPARVHSVAGRLVATIDLSGVRALRVAVHVRVVTRAGRTLRQTHVYRACPGI